MNLKKLLSMHSWLSIEIILLRIWPSEEDNIDLYQEVFYYLSNKEPQNSEVMIHFQWVQDHEKIGAFRLKVAGIVHRNGKTFSPNLALASWEEILGMEIDPETLKSFTELEIIAGCLVEMANRGYREDFIRQYRKMMYELVLSYLYLKIKEEYHSAYAIDFEGKRYYSVKIGKDFWMAENLDTGFFRNGDPIMEARSDEEWNAASLNGYPAWCYYENKPERYGKYGRLYNWFAIKDSRGLAPEGWRIPCSKDFQFLIIMAGGENTAGTELKSTLGWMNPRGTNSYGFNALPAGYRRENGFRNIEYAGYWWSSTEISPKHARNFYLIERSPGSHLNFAHKPWGCSVRCIKNSP